MSLTPPCHAFSTPPSVSPFRLATCFCSLSRRPWQTSSPPPPPILLSAGPIYGHVSLGQRPAAVWLCRPVHRNAHQLMHLHKNDFNGKDTSKEMHVPSRSVYAALQTELTYCFTCTTKLAKSNAGLPTNIPCYINTYTLTCYRLQIVFHVFIQ